MQSFPSLQHKNAWLLFRALCKLSMRGVDTNPSQQADPIAIQSKILSLELLLSVLQSSGPAFHHSERFVQAIRQYLCVSLLRNCTANVPQVVDLSLQVFVQLIAHFKDHLKAEIEVFITKIFLRILESENSTFHHKSVVLDLLHKLCVGPMDLVEIFLSYDADFESIDLFRQLVDALAKCAKGPGGGKESQLVETFGSSRQSRERESTLRRMGLRGLEAILKSLVECCKSPEELQQMYQPRQEDKPEQLPDLPTTPMGAKTNGAADGDVSREEGPTDGSAVAETASITPTAATTNGGGGASDGETVTQAPGSLRGKDVIKTVDRKQRIQEERQRGILQFNLKPNRGLAYLESCGHFKHTPREVAQFLHQFQDELDKTQIGDYMGREKEYEDGFCVKVLHEYIDMMVFEGLVFDDAIRHFLKGFRLPGEAQKIDRMMEKFAAGYCNQNKQVFPSADTAFVLAFSIIMLNTDLHNPAIREERRMTKEGFRRQNEGICNGSNLDEEFVDGIYDRIKANPFVLKEDEEAREKAKEPELASSLNGMVFGTPAERRKRDMFQLEREDMVKAGETIFQQASRRKRQEKQQQMRGKKGTTHSLPAHGNGGNDGGGVGGAADEHGVLGVGVLSGPQPRFQRVAWHELRFVAESMFDVAWGPIVGALSHSLDGTDDQEIVALCLESLCHAIHIAAYLGMSTARTTLVNALAKFTTLDDAERELEPKHVECIKALLKVAAVDGNCLNESWAPVLQCVSRIARLHDSAQGAASDELFFARSPGAPQARKSSTVRGASGATSAAHGKATSAFGGLFGSPSPHEAALAVEETNAEHLVEAVDSLALKIDHIFSSSVRLDKDAIQHFVTQLSAVSFLEIHTCPDDMTPVLGSAPAAASAAAVGGLGNKTAALVDETPRVFSLQKLVEVADFNMDIRPRVIWSNVWGVLGGHFAAAGLHSNHRVAMYAIDSLRQLSLKFLDKDELRDFNFQRMFLKPFEVIIQGSRVVDIRELALQCVDQLILARASNIRSGWKSLFAVLSLAAVDRVPSIAAAGFAIVTRLVEKQFSLVVFDLTELVNCLLSYAGAPLLSIETALAALQHVATCAARLGSGEVDDLIRQAAQAQGTDEAKGQLSCSTVGVDDDKLQLWWPLLLGLAARVGDPRVAVRTSALQVLAETLLTYGHLFRKETWRLVFRGVLFPILESAWTDDTPQVYSLSPAINPDLGQAAHAAAGTSFILTTAGPVFAVCVDLLEKFPEVATGLLPEVLSLLTDCVCQETETLARVGVASLHELVEASAAIEPPGSPALAVAAGAGTLSPPASPTGWTNHQSTRPPSPQQPQAHGQHSNWSVWGLVCDALVTILDRPLPGLLSMPAGDTEGTRTAMTQLVTTLQTLQVTHTLLCKHHAELPVHLLTLLLDACAVVAAQARAFHSKVTARQAMLQSERQVMLLGDIPGTSHRRLPHLVDQEVMACRVLLATLPRVLAGLDPENEAVPGLGRASDGTSSVKLIVLQHLLRSNGRLFEQVVSSPAPEPATDCSAAPLPLRRRVWACVVRSDDVGGEASLPLDEALPAPTEAEQGRDDPPAAASANGAAATTAPRLHVGDVLVLPVLPPTAAAAGAAGGLGEGAGEDATGAPDVAAGVGVSVGGLMRLTMDAFRAQYKPVRRAAVAANDHFASAEMLAATQGRLVQSIQLILQEYTLKERRVAAAAGQAELQASMLVELAEATPLLLQVLAVLEDMPDSFLAEHLTWVLPCACDLICCRAPEVRAALHHLMTCKVNRILLAGLATGAAAAAHKDH